MNKKHTFLVVLLLVLLPSAYASDCNTDCGKKCYKKFFGGKVDDPVCRAHCEARKKLCNATGHSIPEVPGADPGMIPKDPRELYYQECGRPFESIVNWTQRRCQNWPPRMEHDEDFNNAIELLIASRLFESKEFVGIKFRFCPLGGAHGMAPTANIVYIDSAYQGQEIPPLARIMAHEMEHIRQWRAHGDSFRCKYSEELVRCEGCQDNGNRFERQAYAREDQFVWTLNLVGSYCETPVSNCGISRRAENRYVGMICDCKLNSGEILEGRVVR